MGEGLPNSVKVLLIGGVAILVVVVLHLAANVLVPVAQALIVFFVLNALADGVRRVPFVGRHIPRPLVLAAIAVTAFVAGFHVVQVTVRTVGALGPSAAGFRDTLNPLVDRATGVLGLPQEDVLNRFVDGLGVEAMLQQVVLGMVDTISHFSIVALYVGFLLVDQPFFEAKFRALFPDPTRRVRARALLDRMVGSVGSYLWVMTVTSGLITMFSYGVMRLVGLQFAEFWAAAIFFLNYIPTVGSILGTVLPTAFALLQFQQFGPVAVTLAGIGAAQVVVGNILMPHMAGNKLNVSLFVTILALFSWGALWGVTGMFVAMPLTAILIIVLGSIEETRPIAILLSRTGSLEDTPT